MGRLRDRIDRRDEVREESALLGKIWNEYTDGNERFEELYEDGQSNRPADEQLRTQVVGTYRRYKQAASAVIDQERLEQSVQDTGLTPYEMRTRRWMEGIDDRLELIRLQAELQDNPDVGYVIDNVSDEWFRGLRRDLEHNFLYIEWGLQLIESPNPVMTYPGYCLWVASRAVVRLFTHHPGTWQELLSDVWDGFDDHYPEDLESDIIRFVNSGPPDKDHTEYLSRLYQYAPWSFSAAESLLSAYNEAFCVEQDNIIRKAREQKLVPRLLDVPGPVFTYTTPGSDKTYDELRVERAIIEYQSRDNIKSADQLASEYGIAQKRFREELRERGISRPRGRRKAA